MKLIKGISLADSWLLASRYLLKQHEWTDTTVVLHISDPALVRARDKAIADLLNRFLVEHECYGNHTVAETIFPGYEYVHRGVDGVFRCYPDEVYPEIKNHSDARHWGTYAYRLLRRVDANGKEYNPLEKCIKKMQQKKPVRASYEMGFGYGFDLATYDDDEDRAFRLGGPCLSHLSFKLIKGQVHLTAMYRSHYYMQRAYGNILGLARLQSFVADQVGVDVGPLVCHSTMARLEHGSGWAKGDVKLLIDQCTSLMNPSENDFAAARA